MYTKIGIIGTGNMGKAVAQAIVKACAASRVEGVQCLYLANRTHAKAEALAAELNNSGAEIAQAVSNEEIAASCDLIFLAVKPQMMRDMLERISPVLAKREVGSFVLASMAAGLTCEDIRSMAKTEAHIIRMMPNTPVSLGEGVIEYCGLDTTEKELNDFAQLLCLAGILDAIPEHLMDAASAVSGCGPAFAYLFIEALADGGVACGLPRAKAMMYAAKMLSGAAEMVLATGNHPGQLKDAVCSPGGTTIQGVRVLEESGFRAAAMDAVIAAYEKSAELRK